MEDFVHIAETLGEKPGNLLPNDLGNIGHLKPLIDRLASVRPEFLARVTTLIEKIVLLTEDVTSVKQIATARAGTTSRKSSSSPSTANRKGRR